MRSLISSLLRSLTRKLKISFIHYSALTPLLLHNLDDHKFTTNQDLKENVKKKKASTLIKELPDIPKQLKNLLNSF